MKRWYTKDIETPTKNLSNFPKEVDPINMKNISLGTSVINNPLFTTSLIFSADQMKENCNGYYNYKYITSNKLASHEVLQNKHRGTRNRKKTSHYKKFSSQVSI